MHALRRVGYLSQSPVNCTCTMAHTGIEGTTANKQHSKRKDLNLVYASVSFSSHKPLAHFFSRYKKKANEMASTGYQDKMYVAKQVQTSVQHTQGR